ncbi:MAG: DinB family protein [Candidatus Sumerlaeaceae bacterium]
MRTKAEFRKKFYVDGLRTQRLAQVFDDSDLAVKPAEGSMTMAELLAHIIASRNFLRGVFAEEAPTTELFKIPLAIESAAALRRELARSWRAVLDALDGAEDVWLAQTISPFGPDWEMSRLEMADLMLEHEIHHRGQLSVYVRVAGKTPPELYTPVTEEVLED